MIHKQLYMKMQSKNFKNPKNMIQKLNQKNQNNYVFHEIRFFFMIIIFGLLMSGKKILKFEKQEVVQDKSKQEVFNFARLKESIDISVTQNTSQLLEMELKGIDASLANGLRRIIIAEIPTMALHKVFLYQNTSVIPDELLVHRLGLLPIQADPNDFETRKEDQDLNGENSLKFQFRVVCRRKKQFENHNEEDLQKLQPEDYLDNSTVYSNQLKWIPQGNQVTKLNKIKLVHQNIVIAKLRQNQEIYIQIYAEKGIGKKHAKWSPVSTCFYRLMPNIEINSAFNHEKHADDLINCCPSKVFAKKKGKAIVANQRDCTTCRACISLDGIELGKIKDHFIFTIESTGIFTAQDIFLRALKVLQDKAKSYVI